MKLTYDPVCNITYLRLHQKKAQVDTIQGHSLSALSIRK